VYANDFSSVVAKINSHTGDSGVTAVVSSDNKITLSGTGINLKIENYVTDLPSNSVRSIDVQKVVGSNVTDEVIVPLSISDAKVGTQLNDLFEHFNSLGLDLSIQTKVAEGVVESTENTLVYLSEDISKIEDVDMATLLTKLQGLLTSKEAAQATFSRISSKNLFDFMG
jgi:flagellar hook-associated protein 3 FlgL